MRPYLLLAGTLLLLLGAGSSSGCALARSFDPEPAASDSVSADYARAEALRARALSLFDAGDPAAAVVALVERERLLNGAAAVQRNRDLLWDRLSASPLTDAVLARPATPEVRGWLELALLTRSRADATALDQWRLRYPEHPGNERLGMLAREAPPIAAPDWTSDVRGGAIALLLPLTGSLAGTAEAVRDGFLAAHFDGGGSEPVQVYDAGNTPDTALAAYQRALADGAAFVVGPLTKDGVGAIAGLGQLPVPMLALNYLDETRPAPFNFFQFGLAPEDEARAAADHAAAQGLRRAVALVPANDWGDRVLGAFDRRLREQGGAVVAQSRFAQGEPDIGKSIEGLLGTGQSEERHRALVAILGKKVAFEARRRDDIDLVFFGARPQEARLIWPQFRFHRVAEMPAYSTSQVYDGSPERELHGVRFCDMPWMLATSGEAAQLRAQSAGFASHKAYPRLFALGYDAWRLATQARQGSLRSEQTIDAGSGRLTVRGGVVTRGLDCAQITSTGLMPLDAPLLSRP